MAGRHKNKTIANGVKRRDQKNNVRLSDLWTAMRWRKNIWICDERKLLSYDITLSLVLSSTFDTSSSPFAVVGAGRVGCPMRAHKMWCECCTDVVERLCTTLQRAKRATINTNWKIVLNYNKSIKWKSNANHPFAPFAKHCIHFFIDSRRTATSSLLFLCDLWTDCQ